MPYSTLVTLKGGLVQRCC